MPPHSPTSETDPPVGSTGRQAETKRKSKLTEGKLERLPGRRSGSSEAGDRNSNSQSVSGLAHARYVGNTNGWRLQLNSLDERSNQIGHSEDGKHGPRRGEQHRLGRAGASRHGGDRRKSAKPDQPRDRRFAGSKLSATADDRSPKSNGHQRASHPRICPAPRGRTPGTIGDARSPFVREIRPVAARHRSPEGESHDWRRGQNRHAKQPLPPGPTASSERQWDRSG